MLDGIAAAQDLSALFTLPIRAELQRIDRQEVSLLAHHTTDSRGIGAELGGICAPLARALEALSPLQNAPSLKRRVEGCQVTSGDLLASLGNVFCRDDAHPVVAGDNGPGIGPAAMVEHGAEGKEGSHRVEGGFGENLVAVRIQDTEDADQLGDLVVWGEKRTK